MSACVTSGRAAGPAATATAPASQAPRKLPKGSFVVEKARWGVKATWTDVTDLVRARVDDRGILEMNLMKANPIFGDPAKGAWKYFRIEYRYDGAYFSEEFRENDHVILPFDPTPPKGKLEIIDARFGREGAWRDVTERLRKKIDNGKLNFTLHGNAGYLGDPAKGEEKDLIVRYSVDGKIHEAKTTELGAPLLQLP